MAAEQPTADFVIFTLGTADPQQYATRQNAGFIFADYISNCMTMQALLLAKAKAGESTSIEATNIPEDYKHPTFIRSSELGADFFYADFCLTESDLKGNSIKSSQSKQTTVTDATVKKTYKVAIIKPLVPLEQFGASFARSLAYFQVKDIKTQVIVVFEDLNSLPGSIDIQGSGDSRGIQNHQACNTLASTIKTSAFIKWRLGVGQPQATAAEYLAGAFEGQEVDLFGYALDLAGQAFQHFICFGDVKATKKKFANSRKLPKNLRHLPGLIFPINVVDPNAKQEEEEASPKKKKKEGSASPKKEGTASPNKKQTATK